MAWRFRHRPVHRDLSQLEYIDLRFHEQVVARWKTEFLEKAPQIFALKGQNREQEQKIEELERMVGKLTMQ